MEQRPHQLRTIDVGDSPAAWESAGFSLTDGAVTIGSTRINLTPGDERGIRSVGVDGVDAPIDSMPFGPIGRHELGSSSHPNHVVAIDHLVAMSGDVDRTITALHTADIELRRERHLGEGDDAKRQAFFWLGDVILELAGPAVPRENGAGSLWGLALTCADLDAAKDHLGDRLSDPKSAVQPGRRIATLRTRELDISIPLALMSPHRPG